jgi:ribosomal protein L30/L7E
MDKWYHPHHSSEEQHFHWWLDDLDSRQLIMKRISQPTPFLLASAITYELVTELTTKVKTEVKTLEQGHIYTPDALIDFSPDMRGMVNIVGWPTTKKKKNALWCHEVEGVLRCWIEVKPNGYDKHNMLRLAKINQKWVYEKYEKVVNIVKIGNNKGSFFDQTFTPERFFKCDRADRPRKINFTPRSVDEWLQS